MLGVVRIYLEVESSGLRSFLLRAIEFGEAIGERVGDAKLNRLSFSLVHFQTEPIRNR